MSEELKPCPWGHNPTVTKRGDAVGYGMFADSYMIGCDECERQRRIIYVTARTAPIKTKQLVYATNYVFADSLEEVTKLWNTRPIEDAIHAELAAVKAENERMRAALEKLRRTDHYSSDEGYYSCPKSPEHYGKTKNLTCDCGVDDTNAIIDEALKGGE